MHPRIEFERTGCAFRIRGCGLRGEPGAFTKTTAESTLRRRDDRRVLHEHLSTDASGRRGHDLRTVRDTERHADEDDLTRCGRCDHFDVRGGGDQGRLGCACGRRRVPGDHLVRVDGQGRPAVDRACRCDVGAEPFAETVQRADSIGAPGVARQIAGSQRVQCRHRIALQSLLGVHLAKESGRDVYLANNQADATVSSGKAIVGLRSELDFVELGEVGVWLYCDEPVVSFRYSARHFRGEQEWSW